MRRTIIINDDGTRNTMNDQVQQFPYSPSPYSSSPYAQQTDPCLHCSNNPANNPYASGVCYCALPSMYNVQY